MSVVEVVLVALGPAEPGDGLVAGVTTLQRAGARVTLICRHPPSPALAAQLDGAVPLPAGRLAAATTWARVGGRAIALPGPLPAVRLDPDRLPAAVRLLRHRRTRELIRSADVVVAVDQAAIPAAWLAARRHPHVSALSGLPAAVNRWAH